ncbi:hypothetical protein SNEBB_003705 [Seison nebaliae]|nr:hypothetical protein SNEBB_003705 [Seison nebaliae]
MRFRNLASYIPTISDLHFALYVSLRLAENSVFLLSAEHYNTIGVRKYRWMYGRVAKPKNQQRICSAWTLKLIPEASVYTMLKMGDFRQGQQTVQQIANLVQVATDWRLRQINWVSERSRDKFEKIMEIMKVFVGVPNFFDYEEEVNGKYKHFQLKPTFIESYSLLSRLNREVVLSLLGREWNISSYAAMFRSTYHHYSSAAYHTAENVIRINLGMLHEPFYGKDYPLSYVIGAVGSAIAHEINHAFNPNNLQKNNFSPETINWVTKRSDCLLEQYKSFVIPENNRTPFRPEGSRGEIFSDTTGMEIAYDAYQIWKYSNNFTSSTLNSNLNLTDDQLFFIGFSQMWCYQATPITTNVTNFIENHPPNIFRLQSTLHNHPMFPFVFNCSKRIPNFIGNKKTCHIWFDQR